MCAISFCHYCLSLFLSLLSFYFCHYCLFLFLSLLPVFIIVTIARLFFFVIIACLFSFIIIAGLLIIFSLCYFTLNVAFPLISAFLPDLC